MYKIRAMVFLGLLGVISSPAMANDVKLLPHQALYDITLQSAKSSSGIADVHGQMFYSLAETCDAWVSTHRFIMMYDYIDNPSSRVVSEFTTTERKDGRRLDFKTTRTNEAGEVEEVAGSVVRPSDPAKSFQARYTKPKAMTITLAGGTVFPTQHTLQVINNALQNKKYITGTIFDGSDIEGPYDVSGLILKPVSIPERKRNWPKNVDKNLAGAHGWRTQVAIFPLVQKDQEASDYEMDVNLLENGVVTDMSVRYNDFTIDQNLMALTPSPSETCGAPKPPVVKKEVPVKTAPPAPDPAKKLPGSLPPIPTKEAVKP